MGKVVPFSQVERFVKSLGDVGTPVRTILDTNVLIASSYEIKNEHEAIATLLRKLETLGVQCFATVTTKAEFMEFHRRLILTETLLDLVDGSSKNKIPKSVVEEIKKSQASVKSKQARDGSDPIFNDSQIKAIKAEFSAGSHSGHLGWLRLCQMSIKGYINEIERNLEERGIIYLSPNDPAQSHLFTSALEWPVAASLVERTGLSVADAMILNAVNCSVCQFAVSLDFDLGFAVLADSSSKDVLMPDALEREYRHYHFGAQANR